MPGGRPGIRAAALTRGPRPSMRRYTRPPSGTKSAPLSRARPATGRHARHRSRRSVRTFTSLKERAGADVVVAERPVGEQGDLGGEQVGGGALELGHAGQIAVAVDVATEPAGWGECRVRDAVRAGEPDQVGSTWACLLVCGGRQVRRLCEWLAHRSGVPAGNYPGRRDSRARRWECAPRGLVPRLTRADGVARCARTVPGSEAGGCCCSGRSSRRADALCAGAGAAADACPAMS